MVASLDGGQVGLNAQPDPSIVDRMSGVLFPHKTDSFPTDPILRDELFTRLSLRLNELTSEDFRDIN